MNIDNFTSLFFIVAFVIPGFIFNFVHRVFIPVRYEEKEITLLNFITISCVNYGIWSWLIFWIYQSHYYEQHPLRTGFAWLLIVFLSPLFLV